MKIGERIDRVDQTLLHIEKVLIKQEETLRHHVYRTDLAEKRLDAFEKKIEPVVAHVKRADGALKLIGVLALIGTISMAVFKIFVG